MALQLYNVSILLLNWALISVYNINVFPNWLKPKGIHEEQMLMNLFIENLSKIFGGKKSRLIRFIIWISVPPLPCNVFE